MIEPIIIYEDADIVAVNKPTGMLVHPISSQNSAEEPTLSDWFASAYPFASKVGEDMILENGEHVTRPGVVHRLDKDTSGVIVLAKNPVAHAFIKKQFQDRETKKKYLALVCGEVKQNEGVINESIGRGPTGRWSTNPKKDKKVRDAITEYRVVSRLVDKSSSEIYTLMNAFPKTGRTHQIRVHFKSLGNAVAGDPLYGPRRKTSIEWPRLMLHAEELRIRLPGGENVTLWAEVPSDFTAAIAKLTKI